MLPPFGREISDALMILCHQSGTDQKCLDDLTDRAGRQAESGSDHVQPGGTNGQDAHVVLLVRAKASIVKLFQLAGMAQVVERDCGFTERPGNTMACLK